MQIEVLERAAELLEKANSDLEPDLVRASDVRQWLAAYARIEKLAVYGVTALAGKVDDADEVARAAGTSVGKARSVVETGKVLASSDDLSFAMQQGTVSLDQAGEIAAAERSSPGAAKDLLGVAKTESFQVLREKARKAKLEAERHRDLGGRQHRARSARSYPDELGMVHVHLAFQPHVGTPIVNRAEAEARKLQREAKRAADASTEIEPFECYLADAYAALLSGSGGSTRPRRPELVVLVSHDVVKRGWKDVKVGELCKIPGVGPVSPSVAKQIAQDAFLTGVIYDGKDLRQMRRWTRTTPVEVLLALELGEPPDFDGISCVDCGNRFRTENDHVEPHCRLGPASVDNLQPRCWSCHKEKTERDRRAGKLKPGAA